MNFDFEIVIEPDESHVSVAAKDSHHGNMAGSFETFLEVLVSSGRMRGVGSGSGMTMKMGQQSVPELLELD